jgi:hypothetical protein
MGRAKKTIRKLDKRLFNHQKDNMKYELHGEI